MEGVILLDDINDILFDWNLEHLKDKLKEQEISSDILHMLQRHHIEKLLSDFPIGDQVRFEYHLAQWVKLKYNQGDPSNTKKIYNKISVKDILQSTYNGREILNYYKKHKALHEEQRNLLISTITRFIEAQGMEFSLSECSVIEKDICIIFPTEELEFYTNGKRGKTYNKLTHLKRLSKEILKKDDKGLNAENFPEDESLSEFLKFLRSDEITAEEFDIYWRKCAFYRFKQITESKTTAEIFSLWPEYVKPSGLYLINIDFLIKLPSAKNIHERWSQFGDKIVNLFKSKVTNAHVSKMLSDIDTKNEEYKMFMSFWCLHNLFPPQTKSVTESDGSKIRKRFSVADSQEGFALVAATNEEMETKLKLLKLQQHNIQPKLFIILEQYKIKSIFVYVDEIRYPFMKFLEAFDTLFKIFSQPYS